MRCTESETGTPGVPDATAQSRRGRARPRGALVALGLGMLVSCASPPAPTPAQRSAAAAPGVANAPAASSRRPARSIDEYRLQAAARLLAANPKITYTTPAPDPLLAIPVLEIEVNGDGSIRHITVMRMPTQATDTVQIAIDAVKRAAPFGDATHLPKPWKFTEVFLFDDDRHFKPRSLD